MALAHAGALGLRVITAGLTSHAFDNARQWIAADVMAEYFGRAPAAEQTAAVRRLGPGVESTLVAELPVMLSSDSAADPITAAAKIVTVPAYPYYGRVTLQTGRELSAVLDTESLVASPDVLQSLSAKVGDTVQINHVKYRIADVIAFEPDRYAVPPTPIGRVILSQNAFDRTGLMQFGALGIYRVLLRTDATADRRALSSRLEQLFPDARVIDYTSRTPETTAVIEWVIPFFNIFGVLAVSLGGLAIAATVHLHLLRGIETIAILKSLGGTTRRIAEIYFLQVIALAFVAAVLGTAGGYSMEFVFSHIAYRDFGFGFRAAGWVGAAAETALLTLIVASATAWVPISRVRSIPAFVLLRRDAGEKLSIRKTVAEKSGAWPLAVTGGLALMALVFLNVETLKTGGYVLVGIGAGLWGTYVLSELTTVGLFLMVRRRAHWLPWTVRHAIANLHRNRRSSRIAMVVLANALAFIVIAVTGGNHLGSYVLDSLPFHTPNLLVIHIDESRRTDLSRFLEQQPGVEAPSQFVPSAWVALSRVGESSLDAIRSARPDSFTQRNWPASCAEEQPPFIEVVRGHWWHAGEHQHSVALTEDLAGLLGVTVGSRMEFVAGRQPIQAQVSALLRIPAAQRAWWREIIFDCEALPGALYSGAITIDPVRFAEVRQSLRERFPDLIFLEINDLLDRTETTGRRALRILGAIGIVGSVVAVCLMLGIIGALRAFRIYEIAVMRVLGAKRSAIMAATAVEYLALGAIAGVLGCVVGTFATVLIVLGITGATSWVVDFQAILIVTAVAAILTSATGVFGSLPLFRPKPLEIIRRQ